MYYDGIWTGRGRNVDAALADVFAQIRADPTLDHPEILRVDVIGAVPGETEAEAGGGAAAALEDGVGECTAVLVDGGFLFAAYFNGDTHADDD